MALSQEKAVDSWFEKASDRSAQTFQLAANAVVYKGAAICKQDGYAYVLPAEVATGLISLGIALDSADNTGGDDGDLSVRVLSGVWLLKNSEADALTIAHVGLPCYFEDDETVSSDATGTSVAGNVCAISTRGVFVRLDSSF